MDRSQVLFRTALILAAHGGEITDVTVGDVVQLLDAEADFRSGRSPSGCMTLYRVLHELTVFAADTPTTLRALRTSGQRSPEQLIDRYQLTRRPVRDLLVEYLRERQPALDYTSLEALAYFLGQRFWADIEAHHPHIDTLHLPRDVADAWKRRLRTITRATTTATGTPATRHVERINYRECLTSVRAFYLDLAHWAVEDPARWARWVAPCPVGEEEINRKKAKRHRKARMDARTRERLPALPTLVSTVRQRRDNAAATLHAASRARPGEHFTAADGTRLLRAWMEKRSTHNRIWAEDPDSGTRRDLTREDDHAFWGWAVVEVLRATGLRVEETCELNHYSLVEYRLPDTGELVPLLQIAPSKTDAERLLLVSPELSEVLSVVIQRIRDDSGTVPLVARYDGRERRWSAPAPLLFQRRIDAENRAIQPGAVSRLLGSAVARTVTASQGAPHYTPHDFRRMFITDAILNGLPPHIAQVIAGHRDINVTLGYKATYPDEAIQAHLAFLARRRALRPERGIPHPYRRGMGGNSSATSNAGRSPPGPAAGRSARHASTNTPASDAPCSGPNQPSSTASKRSATTCTPASRKLAAKAGQVSSKDYASASPAPRTSSARSTAARAQPTSECRQSNDPPSATRGRRAQREHPALRRHNYLPSRLPSKHGLFTIRVLAMTFPAPAEKVLQPWRDFPVERTPRPVVLLDLPVHIGDEGFVDGDAKLSWMSAAIDTTVPLPDGIINLITGGRPRRAAPGTLTIADVERCDEEFWCDRGPRRLPAYRLDISGLRQPCIIIDPTLDCWWPVHNDPGRAHGALDHATINDDDLTLNFPAFGGILTLFHRAEFIEYPTCVVGRAITSERPSCGRAVRAVGIRAKVTAQLNTPLGGRVLLREDGEPVRVIAEGNDTI